MGAYMVVLQIPRTPPSLNVMLRAHWRKRSVEQGIWDSFILAEWMRSGKFVFTHPVKVIYTIKRPDDRKRDIDKYIGGTKFITDALKRTFLTRDDSEWLTEISVRFAKGPEQTEVNIAEV